MPLAQSGGSNVGTSQIIDNEIMDADVNAAAAIKRSKLDFGTGLDNTDIKAGAAIAESKVDFGDGIDLANLKENVIKTAEISVSAAEVLAMSVTPKEIIAAPGDGKIIICEDITLYLNAGATGFSGTTTVRFTYANSALLLHAIEPTIQGTVDKIFQLNKNDGIDELTAGINKAVILRPSSGAFTAGDGSLKVLVKYRIITL